MRVLSLKEQLFFCTTLIETEEADGLNYKATAFFFNLKIDNLNFPLIVTNKHVLNNAEKCRFRFTKRDPVSGDPILNNLITSEIQGSFIKQLLINHPNPDVDLCALPISSLLNVIVQNKEHIFIRFFSNSDIPTAEQVENFDAIEDVLMIGYPNGLWDSVNNMPVVRRGITATPYRLDYMGKKEFLIDAACFQGSSGSPVLICHQGGFSDKRGNFTVGSAIYLIGILHAIYEKTVSGEIKQVEVPGSHKEFRSLSQLPTNLGIIIKAEMILDFIPVIRDKYFNNK